MNMTSSAFLPRKSSRRTILPLITSVSAKSGAIVPSASMVDAVCAMEVSPLKQRCLPARKVEAEVFISKARSHAASRGAVEEADLDEERLVNLFERVFLFGKRCGQRAEPNRPAIVLLNNRKYQPAIDFVEAVSIHFKHGEGGFGGRKVDRARAAHLRIVANAAQQAIRNARRSARAQRNLSGAILIDRNLHPFRGAGNDEAKFIFRVKLQAQQNAKP